MGQRLLLWSVILICFFCLATVLYYVRESMKTNQWIRTAHVQHIKEEPHSHYLELQQGLPLAAVSEEVVPKPSRFLYLLQTESCLPSHLKSVEVIGNASSCQCDVLVLIFKKKCSDTPPAHVEYLFNHSTSWGMGRNLLFEVARRRGEKYLYYIFMDDDIVLKTRTTKTPWRMFEDFLKRVEPAVAAVDVDTHPCLQNVYSARMKQGCPLKHTTDYVPAARFDEAFNAFHYQAVEHILPYSCRLDATSWWYAGFYAAVKMEIIFAGHSVLHTKLIATNPKHRQYPRKEAAGRDLLDIVHEIEVALPEKY